jgi:hypothetical protein
MTAQSGTARDVLSYIDATERRLASERAHALASRPQRLLTLPLLPNVYADLRIAHPMTAQEWDRLIDLLLVMRPGIVEAEDV